MLAARTGRCEPRNDIEIAMQIEAAAGLDPSWRTVVMARRTKSAPPSNRWSCRERLEQRTDIAKVSLTQTEMKPPSRSLRANVSTSMSWNLTRRS